jgi:hypothetical protein
MIRTNVELAVEVGARGSLDEPVFGPKSIQAVLDTLDHVSSGTFKLEGGEANYDVPFGDVEQSRIVFLQADGPIRVTPGGGVATGAIVTGVGGSYPTGFTGVNQNLDFEVDGTAIAVDFESTDQSLAQVVNRINAAAALAGILGPGSIPTTVARSSGGQLRFVSPTTGEDSEINILNTSAAAVLTALGLTSGSTVGEDSAGASDPITLMQPAAGESDACDDSEGVQVYLLATLVTGSLVVENLDPDTEVEVVYMVAGDLTTD